MLPDIVKGSGIRKVTQVRFGGYDRRPEAGDGTFYDTLNLTTEQYPLLASRGNWYKWAGSTEDVEAVYGTDHALIWVEHRDQLYYNGWLLSRIRDGIAHREIVQFGRKAVITGDNLLLDLTWPLLGIVEDPDDLPEGTEGDAWAVGDAEAAPGSTGWAKEIYVYTDGAWAAVGPLLQELEAEATLQNAYVGNGSYQDEPAEMNTIYSPGAGFDQMFRAGDAVTISGCTAQPGNNQTLIIREVTPDALRFYEFSFNLPGQSVYTVPAGGLPMRTQGMVRIVYKGIGDFNDGGTGKALFVLPFDLAAGTKLIQTLMPDGTPRVSIQPYSNPEFVYLAIPVDTVQPAEIQRDLQFVATEDQEQEGYYEGTVTIRRSMPEMDVIFEGSNRLWGCKGSDIYASKLGDPSNWYHFDGTADDSWSLRVQSPGAFTGAICHDGYPTFFKERKRYKIYGTQPSEYQVAELDCNGVKAGCSKSLQVVAGVLYYLSPCGVMADSGALPRTCGEELGPDAVYTDAAAGVADTWYHISMLPAGGTAHEHFVLDTACGIWLRLGPNYIQSFVQAAGQLYGLTGIETGDAQAEPELWSFRAPSLGGAEDWELLEMPYWMAETNDYVQEDPNRKRIHRVQIRARLDDGAKLEIGVKYDSEENWRTVKTVTGDGRKQSWYIPVRLRRCDHFRLRFRGWDGGCVLHSLALETMHGSAVH